MSQAIAEPVEESSEIESQHDRSPWRGPAWAVVIVYWLAMFGGTHWPKAPHTPFGTSDKWMHFSAYLGLAILLSATTSIGRQISLARSVGIVLLLAGYGALDELTQPLVNRDCDIWDWFADVAGILLGTGLFLLVSAARRRFSSQDE